MIFFSVFLSSTAALLRPKSPELRTSDVNIYGARVPVAGLLAQTSGDRQPAGASLEELWARAFFSTTALKLEARLAGRGTVAAGQLGEDGFKLGASLLSQMNDNTMRTSEWNIKKRVVKLLAHTC